MKTHEIQISKELEIPLTEKDLADMAKTAGGVQWEIDQKEAQFDVQRKNHNADVSSLKERLEGILQACNKGKQTRTVDCTQKMIYENFMVQYVFEGQVVEERAMTPEETQQDLFDGPKEKLAQTDEQLSIDEQIAQDIRESTSKASASSALDGGA